MSVNLFQVVFHAAYLSNLGRMFYDSCENDKVFFWFLFSKKGEFRLLKKKEKIKGKNNSSSSSDIPNIIIRKARQTVTKIESHIPSN
jgi:hypothetical protein